MQFQMARILLVAIAVLTVAHGGPTAEAGLLSGKEMTLSVADPTKNFLIYTSPRFVVGDGPELTLIDARPINFVLDVSDALVMIQYPSPQRNLFNSDEFNGYVLTDLPDPVAPFGSARVDPNTTLAGFDNSRLSFDEHNLYLNVRGLTVRAGDALLIRFIVPEPSAVAILFVGGIGLFVYYYRGSYPRR
jgi:hypothetical protein